MLEASWFLLAAGAAPPFFAEVAALLLASALVAYLCHRLKITPIVSFLVTGALIGPHALGLVTDETLIEAIAEVGVVLLLFTIGIEFSLAKLNRIRRVIFLGGGLQVGLTIALVAGVLALVGVGLRPGLYTGCLVALSSTAIVLKLLMSEGQTSSAGGQTVLGVLIFQDLAVVAMVLLVPALAGEGGTPLDIAWALTKAVGIVVLVLVGARRVMPRVLEAVARTCSQEIFVLTVMAICFGTAWLTSLAGVSLSLGAFLAGLIVSESRFSELAFGEIQPLQILFSATFFVSVGLLLDLSFIAANLGLVLAVVLALFVVKIVVTGIAVKSLGVGLGTVAFSSLTLAQVGEFSFVLERTGREMGLFPAGLADGGPQTFIAATVLTMMVTPLLARLGGKLSERVERRRGAAHEAAMAMDPDGDGEVGHEHLEALTDHVVVAGYGRTGRALARALDHEGIPYLVLTLSPDGARDAESLGLAVLRGNYTRQHELMVAGLRRARLLVVADDDLETTHRVVDAARALAPDLEILAATRLAGERRGLAQAGAGRVVAAEDEAALSVVDSVLGLYGVDDQALHRHREAFRREDDPDALLAEAADTVRLTKKQRETTECSHIALTGPVVPQAKGCVECLATGDEWVHLRLCMTCGHVGCCDESNNKHATAHAHAAGHPVIRSFEEGEGWGWCYVDEVML